MNHAISSMGIHYLRTRPIYILIFFIEIYEIQIRICIIQIILAASCWMKFSKNFKKFELLLGACFHSVAGGVTMAKRIVSASMIDMSAMLTSEQLAAVLDELKAQPGGWVRIKAEVQTLVPTGARPTAQTIINALGTTGRPARVVDSHVPIIKRLAEIILRDLDAETRNVIIARARGKGADERESWWSRVVKSERTKVAQAIGIGPGTQIEIPHLAGDYLQIRSYREGTKFLLSLMQVETSGSVNEPAMFITKSRRVDGLREPAEVRGILYQVGDRFITLGKESSSAELRTAFVRTIARANSRKGEVRDLRGVRLGMGANGDSPEAHRIVAMRLPDGAAVDWLAYTGSFAKADLLKEATLMRAIPPLAQFADWVSKLPTLKVDDIIHG
jgi:hypothetical protein